MCGAVVEEIYISCCQCTHIGCEHRPVYSLVVFYRLVYITNTYLRAILPPHMNTYAFMYIHIYTYIKAYLHVYLHMYYDTYIQVRVYEPTYINTNMCIKTDIRIAVRHNKILLVPSKHATCFGRTDLLQALNI